jgi:hypothetical protein
MGINRQASGGATDVVRDTGLRLGFEHAAGFVECQQWCISHFVPPSFVWIISERRGERHACLWRI